MQAVSLTTTTAAAARHKIKAIVYNHAADIIGAGKARGLF